MRKRQYRCNPEIRLGSKFFQAPIKDYGDVWRECWWREAIQNSVDAGATQIICETKINENKTVTISVADNGYGMVLETLITKFMAFAETSKEGSEESVGGFGKAKELLLLPWLFWEIITSKNGETVIIRGKGNKYEPPVLSQSSLPNGTKVTVIMPADQCTTDVICKSFIRKCFVPQTKFIVNGEEIPADLAVGNPVTQNEDLVIYWNENQKITESVKAIVRVKGIYMFRLYFGSNSSFEGTIVVELTKSSVEVLAPSRNELSKSEDRWFISKFAGTLEKDVRSGLRGAGFRVRKIYTGSGKFSSYAKDQTTDDLSHLVSKFINNQGTKNKKIELSGNALVEIKEIIKQLQDNADPEELATPKVIDNSITPEMSEAMLSNVTFLGTHDSDAAIKQLLWEPDFFLVNEIKEYKIPLEFTPDAMSNAAKRIARLWAALCQFVLIQLGKYAEFGIGFIFSHNKNTGYWIGAEYVAENGQDWLMINPFINGNPTSLELYDINNEDHVDKMYALAIHECTHIADGISYHDEDFTSALTSNIAKVVRGRKNLREIRDSVRSKFKMHGSGSKASSEPKQSFYKILTGIKGKPRLTDTLAEARVFADMYPDKLVKIIGYFMPTADDRSSGIEVGNVEYRYKKESYRDEIAQDLEMPTSIEDSLGYVETLAKNLGYDHPGAWKRKLRKKKRRK